MRFADFADTVAGQSRHPNSAPAPHPFNQHVSHTQQLVPHQIQHPATTNAYVQPYGGWTPASSPAVARSRAQRRFWVAMIYAWLIYILIGSVINALAFLIITVRREFHCPDRC